MKKITLCTNCHARPVSRKLHSVLCGVCTDAIYDRAAENAVKDDGFDLFAKIKANHGVKSW